MCSNSKSPNAFRIYTISNVEGYQPEPVSFVGSGKENVAKIFLETLEKEVTKIHETFPEPVPIIISDEDIKEHENSEVWYSCRKPFVGIKVLCSKVKDHCHYTGKYRGALHSKCNLALRDKKTILVIAHNTTNYDTKLFIKYIAESI